MTPNPFLSPREWRHRVINEIHIPSTLRFTRRGFICALVTSRCHVGCQHCMFASNMDEVRTVANTMTDSRVEALLRLVEQSNTGYFLVSGGGDGFLELPLMYKIIEGSKADVTWMVTSGFWGRHERGAQRVLAKCLEAHRRGLIEHSRREIVIRISVDQYHLDRLGSKGDALDYVRQIIRVFERDCAGAPGFSLMLHAIEGEEALIDELAHQLGGSLQTSEERVDYAIKVTEHSMNLLLPSGFIVRVTFAKLLLSDMAADLQNEEVLARRVRIWEADAYVNEHDRTGLQLHEDGYGNDMLVIYDGRVAGGWQCEMPDIRINIDEHDYAEVMRRTLCDPGVLATLEKGHRYRFETISEVNTKACTRAKAINIRDYTSLVLLEEDIVKLYYTIRAVQDYISEGRLDISKETLTPIIQQIITSPRDQLRLWYRQSGFDIVKQYRDYQPGFKKFEAALLRYATYTDEQQLAMDILDASHHNLRQIDQWRLLLLRIQRKWYDITTWPEVVITTFTEVIRVIDEQILRGKRPFEGLSMQSLC